MSLLLDSCVPNKFKGMLIAWEYVATFSHEHIQADSPDPDVLDLAQDLDAVLLTVDMDFSNVLVYPPQNYQGIVVMRYQPNEEAPLIRTLKQALDDLYREKLRRVLVIVQPERYRIRRGFP